MILSFGLETDDSYHAIRLISTHDGNAWGHGRSGVCWFARFGAGGLRREEGRVALTRRDTQPRIESPRGPVERFAEAMVDTLADTALAQEIHMLLTHILCDSVETELATREGAQA